MVEQLSLGQIYLADQRSLEETTNYRRYSTFGYSDAYKRPFGNLTVFNDEIIAAGKQITLTVTADCFFMVMPITGLVGITINAQAKIDADAGQIFIRYVKQGSSIMLQNDYAGDWINLLYLQVRVDREVVIPVSTIDFDLASNQNQLISLLPSALPFGMRIGMFDGRNDAVYQVRSKQSRLFGFVLAGAFEFQGRLMHERDGLALWDLHEADMEALSNNAIVVLLEQY